MSALCFAELVSPFVSVLFDFDRFINYPADRPAARVRVDAPFTGELKRERAAGPGVSWTPAARATAAPLAPRWMGPSSCVECEGARH